MMMPARGLDNQPNGSHRQGPITPRERAVSETAPTSSPSAERQRYLRETLQPLVEQLRAGYSLTTNPVVHAHIRDAIALYEAALDPKSPTD